MALGYLLEPFIQIQNVNGTPIVGAKIYVYNADTTNLATTYNDFEGHLNTNPVITDDLGNATIIADDGIEYDVSVHDENDLLLFTKKYISIDKTSSASGTTQVAPGYGISVERVGNTFIVSVDTDLIATKDDLADKQDKLTGGANIEITDDNVINVVQRREIVVQNPLKIERSPSRLKIYLDEDYDQYKTKQDEVIIGGSSANYISKITQTENGNVSADIGNFVAGSNINIANNNGNLTISGKDWNNDITAAVSGKLDTSIYNTFVESTNSWDKTAYSGGTGISVSNHQISCNGDITPYSGSTGISVSNHQISCNGDITPYTGSKYITVSNHQISLSDSFVAVYRLPKSASCNKDGTRYTIFSQAPGIGIADTYTFSTLYNASTQKYELELSNDNSRIFSVYIDGVFVDYVGALRKKIYETADTMKPIKIELVGAGVGNRTPLYKFTVIFAEYSPGYMVSLYIEYDYNFSINV